MKSVALTMFLLSIGTTAGISGDTTDSNKIENLYACALWPLCDPDVYIYSPILQPKDEKAETQDTKDNKLA